MKYWTTASGASLRPPWVARCGEPFQCIPRRVKNTLAFAVLAVFLPLLGCDQASNSGQSAPSSVTQPQQVPSGNGTAPADKLNPELAPIFSLIRQRQSGPARVRLVNYLTLHPNDGQAEFLFGLSYHREQKYGEALPHYDKALAHAPAYSLTNHFRGWANYYMGNLDEARKAFDAFLMRQPDEPDSLFALGLIELDEDNLDEAERYFRRSIETLTVRDPSDAKGLSKAHTRLGEVHDRRGEYDRAKIELTRATELFPDHYEAFYKLYRVLIRLGEKEQAEIVHQTYLATRERMRPGTSFPE